MAIDLVTNQDYLPALMDLLSKAKKKIDILSYSFAIGSAAGKLSTAGAPYQIASKLIELKKAKGEELRIRFFTEGLRDTSLRNRVTADFLRAGGIEVVYGSTHAKGLCIDERYVLFGSTNLTQQSIMKNNEANLLIDSRKCAKIFTDYFEHLWEGGGHGGVTLKRPFLADGDFKDELLSMINRAKKQIEFSIYFFHHREIEKALVEAFQRGVKVRGFIHQHNAFALSYIRANRATVRRMRKEGLENLFLSVPDKFSHAKFIVVDRSELMLGTGNWLVEDVVTHPQLTIQLKDKVLSRKLVKFLDDEIEKQSTSD